jgi:hypothetical protein
MGYFSAVGIVVKKDKYLKELNNFNKEKIETLLTDFEVSEQEGDFLFYNDSCKWDDLNLNTPETELMTLLNSIDHDDFLFIRLGDDTDDNEIQGGYWNNKFDMGFLRSITTNVVDLEQESYYSNAKY